MMNSNSNIASKTEKIKLALAEYLKKAENDELKGLETIGINKRSFSTIVYLKITTSKTSRQVVMKTVNHHPINKAITDRENQAVVEYNILKYLYPKFQEVDKCSVPRPILVIPEIETFVMEYVEGRLLIDELRWDRYLSPRKKFIELKDHFYNSGRWLRRFQEFTGIYQGSSDILKSVIERAESRLQLIEKSDNPSFPKNLFIVVRTFLSDQLKKLSGMKIPVSGRHSDFHPLNILAGQNGVTVIDFMGYQKDCVAVDVLKMIVHLEDETRSLTASCRRVEILKEKFLEGYGKIPVVPLPALFICEAIHRIVSILGNISNKSNLFHHWIESDHRIKTHSKWFLNEDRKLLWTSL